MDPVNCAELGGSVLAENLTCLGDQDGNGLDDGCESPKAVLGPPPVITMAVSRKMHGEAGTFDLDVCASIAIECRSHGPTQIVIVFDQPVQQTGGTVSDVSVSSGTVSTLAINDSQLTITMDGATDGQFLTIGFPGITGMTGQTANETLCFGVLNGDATGDKAVNIFDMLALKNIVNQPVTVDNYRMDITANGNINVLDLLAAKNNLYKTLNGSCP